ncbi:MAG: fibronectin type III domain-containing protein, partial [Bacteroidales bacterium]|nr:fibronectin type III domain-containing protein [Bacteroidales bacterium]
MKKTLFLLIAIVFAMQGWSQTTVELPVGAGGNMNSFYTPYSDYYNYSYSQSIYDQNTLAAGTITAIKYYYNFATGTTRNPISIYMYTTSKNTFASATDFDSVHLGQLVFNGSITSATGWVTITLDSEYYYDGTGNLQISVDNNAGMWTSGAQTHVWRTFATSGNKSAYRLGDSYNVDPLFPVTSYASPVSSGAVAFAPSIIFVMEPDDPTLCFPPTGANAINVTNSSADIVWNPDVNVTGWTVEYKRTLDTSWSTGETTYVTDTFVSIASLDANTNYDVRIIPDCFSAIAATLSFRTACGYITTLPWMEDFESSANGSNLAAIPTCWARNTDYSTTYYPYVSSSASTAYSGSQYLSFSYGSTAAHTAAVAPPIDTSIDITTLRVKFKMRYPTVYPTTGLQLGIMTDPTNWSTFVPVGPRQVISTANVWEDKEIYLNTYVPTDPSNPGNYIALATMNGDGSMYAYVDDFEISEIPNCVAIDSLSVSNITLTGADITWSSSGGEWLVEYKPASISDWTDPAVVSQNVYTNSLSIVGTLAHSTNYDVRVREVCGTGNVLGEDFSDWRMIDFRTACGAISTFPHFENFDSSPSGANLVSIPTCWSRNTNYTTAYYPYVMATTTSYSGGQCLYLYGPANYHIAEVTPKLDTSIDITTLRVKFK